MGRPDPLPALRGRCTLELTAVPTYPQVRPYTVQVSENVDYAGWALAVDPDDADDQARRLLAEGNQNSRIGQLDVIHRDLQVMANDAREVCWRCRTNPSMPHSACPHPAPPTGPAVPQASISAPALLFDPIAATRWLRAASTEHPGTTNADALGVDDELFGRGLEGFLTTVADAFAANPTVLVRRIDVLAVLLWPASIKTSRTSPTATPAASRPRCPPWTPSPRRRTRWSAPTSAPTPPTSRKTCARPHVRPMRAPPLSASDSPLPGARHSSHNAPRW